MIENLTSNYLDEHAYLAVIEIYSAYITSNLILHRLSTGFFKSKPERIEKIKKNPYLLCYIWHLIHRFVFPSTPKHTKKITATRQFFPVKNSNFRVEDKFYFSIKTHHIVIFPKERNNLEK